LQMDELTPAQARGLAVYNIACEACHGGATNLQVVNRQVHDLAFVKLKADGNVEGVPAPSASDAYTSGARSSFVRRQLRRCRAAREHRAIRASEHSELRPRRSSDPERSSPATPG